MNSNKRTDMVNLVQSIKGYYGLKQEHESNKVLDEAFNLRKPKHVVLMCLDGLGYSLLPKAPFLLANAKEKINTVFPPTTACATITLQTGLYPCEHGWIGWSQYFKEYDEVIELFSGMNFYTREQHDINSVTKDIAFNRFYNNIKNTKTFLPKFDPNGYATFAEMMDATLDHINSNDTSFSYVYWNDPDHTLHVEGSKSNVTNDVIKNIDDIVNEFSKNVKDTMIIVTADHGHIDCKSHSLNQYPNLLATLKHLPSIEPRCANFFVREGMKDQFVKEAQPLLKYFDLYTKEEFLNVDFFKNDQDFRHSKIDDFIGDFLLIAKNEYYLSLEFEGLAAKEEFKSAHAGITDIEMEIPLIII